MKLLDLHGRNIKKNVIKYLIQWNKKSRSKLQFAVKQLLKPIWFSDVVFEEFPVFGSRLKIDFFNATKKIAVEVNGPQHEAFSAFFHDNSPQKFVKSIKRDVNKNEWCEKNDIILIEIIEKDLSDNKTFYSKFC